jgi:cysteine desulfurase
MIYLDHNATSPLRPEARAAMLAAQEAGGNPSSIHAAGRTARALVEAAREQVAALADVAAEQVIFTGGGTEADWLALNGAIAGALEGDARITRLFVSAIEHDAVRANAAALGDRVAGLRVETLPVTADGVLDLDALREALREGKGRALVAVMAANNETGVIQPLEEVRGLTLEAGALLHVDAVQAAGKMALGEADYVAISAHKVGGPQGVGALIVNPDAPFAAQTLGGGQEMRRRAGTLNVPGIAGFGAAVAAADFRGEAQRVVQLRDRFEAALKNAIGDVVIFGEPAQRLPNTSNFAVPGLTAQTAVMALDLEGVMVSSGAACSSGKVAGSHVLAAMGVSEALAGSRLRISFGWNSGDGDGDAAVAVLEKAAARAPARAVAEA